GYGAREAVLRAARGEPGDAAPFGTPVPLDELHRVLAEVGLRLGEPGHLDAVRIVAFAHGWRADQPSDDGDIRLRPLTP
ncbi:MAG TPA: F420-dependent oxidoreductase, partial [Nocardioides sp.]|nr:F420-dependent oxidoreductase [Nocardioides sp.]